MAALKISKPLRKKPGQWHVTCETCTGDDFVAMMRPWCITATWGTAVQMVALHRRLHAEQQCGTCGHEPKIPSVVILSDVDRTLFKIGETLYRMTPAGPIVLDPGPTLPDTRLRSR